MKKIQSLTIFLITISFLASCKKQGFSSNQEVTVLNIVNAIPGSSGIIANINNKLPYYLNQTNTGYGAVKFYSFPGGSASLSLRQTTDTTHELLGLNLDLPNHKVHSLFLTGSVSAPESIFMTDDLPLHANDGHGGIDSSAGVRFINLSPGSSPISVNLVGQPNGSEVSSLAYKAITSFKNYPTVAAISSYKFEFRNTSTGTLLTTYTINGVNNGTGGNTSTNSIRFKNITIVFRGLPGAQSTFVENNY